MLPGIILSVQWTYLGTLLARTSLALGVREGGGLLSGLGRLSLRKEDQQTSTNAASSLNSRENTGQSRD